LFTKDFVVTYLSGPWCDRWHC